MGKRELEPLIQEEIQEFLLKVKENEPFDFSPFIHLAVTNVIASIVFGQRFDYEDEAFMSLIKTMNETVQAATKMWLTAKIPFLTWLPFDLSGREVGQRNIMNLNEFIMDAITQRKKKLVSENANDFIEQYLLKIEEEKENKETTFYGKIPLQVYRQVHFLPLHLQPIIRYCQCYTTQSLLSQLTHAICRSSWCHSICCECVLCHVYGETLYWVALTTFLHVTFFHCFLAKV